MRLKIIKLLLKGLKMAPEEIVEFRDSGFTLAPNEQIAADAHVVANHAYRDGLNRGVKLGQYQVMVYTKDNPTWQDIAEKFDFDSLKEKYSDDKLPK